VQSAQISAATITMSPRRPPTTVVVPDAASSTQVVMETAFAWAVPEVAPGSSALICQPFLSCLASYGAPTSERAGNYPAVTFRWDQTFPPGG
jgi:hypothetical protein